MKRETNLGGGAGYLNKLESKSGQAAIFENVSIQVLVCIHAFKQTHTTQNTQ